MNKPNTPEPSRLPEDDDFDDTGPQNEEEQELYDLLMEGLNSGPPIVTTIEAFCAGLRARIPSER